jgi:hypothetical protein
MQNQLQRNEMLRELSLFNGGRATRMVAKPIEIK